MTAPARPVAGRSSRPPVALVGVLALVALALSGGLWNAGGTATRPRLPTPTPAPAATGTATAVATLPIAIPSAPAVGRPPTSAAPPRTLAAPTARSIACAWPG